MSPKVHYPYLAAGWKRIVDEPPKTEDGCMVEVSGWDETADSIVRVYKQVPDEPQPTRARVFSKLKLVAALKAADKWVLVKTWIEERGWFSSWTSFIHPLAGANLSSTI